MSYSPLLSPTFEKQLGQPEILHYPWKERSTKRAAIACLNCRSRKVRCDVTVVKGGRCTNCCLDDTRCQVLQKGRKFSKLRKDAISDSRIRSRAKQMLNFDILDVTLDDTISESFRDCRGSPAESPKLPSSIETDDGRVEKLTRDREVRDKFSNRNVSSRTVSGEDGGQLEQDDQSSIRTPYADFEMETGDSQAWLRDDTIPNDSIGNLIEAKVENLPAFIQRNPTLDSDVIKFLQSNDVFNVPGMKLLNELVRKYMDFVHPFLPVIDPEEFLSAVSTTKGPGTVSLLLLYSVIFTAVPYVSESWLMTAGYKTRYGAQETFLGRIKLLLDFNFNTDELVTCQALLHLTWSQVGDQTMHDADRYLKKALVIAHGRSRCLAPDAGSDTEKNDREWRRIWSILYTQDWLLALGRREPFLPHTDIFIPPVEPRGFESVAASTINSFDFKNHPKIQADLKVEHDPEVYSVLRSLTQAGRTETKQSDFSCCDGDSKISRSCGAKADMADLEALIKHDNRLRQWDSGLLVHMRHDTHNLDNDRVRKFHLAFLRSLHLAAVASLHYVHKDRTFPKFGLFAKICNPSRIEARRAAREIGEVFGDLEDLQMLQMLPMVSVSILMIAVKVHLSELDNEDTILRRETRLSLHECTRFLSLLTRTHRSAEAAVAAIEAVGHKRDDVQYGNGLYAMRPKINDRVRTRSSKVTKRTSVAYDAAEISTDVALSHHCDTRSDSCTYCPSLASSPSAEDGSPLGVAIPYWSRESTPSTEAVAGLLSPKFQHPPVQVMTEWTGLFDQFIDIDSELTG